MYKHILKDFIYKCNPEDSPETSYPVDMHTECNSS